MAFFQWHFPLFALIIFYAKAEVQVNENGYLNFPAFCTRTSVLKTDVEYVDASQAASKATVRLWTNVRLELNGGETACFLASFTDDQSEKSFNLTNSDSEKNASTVKVLYVFRYVALRQSHPIRHRYIFGIPLLSSKCVCDCAGGDRRCTPNSKYTSCSTALNENKICYKTFHPSQTSTGCAKQDLADVCCDVTATAYKNWKFIAVDIGQPIPFGEFSYQIFRYGDHRNWLRTSNRTFEVPLNRLTRINISDDTLNEVLITAQRPFWELQSGSYFYRDETADDVDAFSKFSKNNHLLLQNGPPINHISEWSLNKLGWFRFNETSRKWYVAQAAIKFQSMHHVRVSDCKRQMYSDQFSADFHATSVNKYGDFENNNNYDDEPEIIINEKNPADAVLKLSKNVAEKEFSWIGEIVISDDRRSVLVTQRDASPIALNFDLKTSADAVRFVYHRSNFDDFRAEIRLDANSNRFLNLTVVNAKGTILGSVYKNDVEKEKNGILAFSIYFSSNTKKEIKNAYFALPPTIDEKQYVCLRGYENSESEERCAWAEYNRTPLEKIDEEYFSKWAHKKTDCKECNKNDDAEENNSSPFKKFLKYLNPSEWVNGVSGWSDTLAVALEIGFYLIIFLIISAVCRRFLCPVISWAMKSNPKKREDN